jgi:hypothetical protein
MNTPAAIRLVPHTSIADPDTVAAGQLACLWDVHDVYLNLEPVSLAVVFGGETAQYRVSHDALSDDWSVTAHERDESTEIFCGSLTGAIASFELATGTKIPTWVSSGQMSRLLRTA